jgi:hypothetical protein
MQLEDSRSDPAQHNPQVDYSIAPFFTVEELVARWFTETTRLCNNPVQRDP